MMKNSTTEILSVLVLLAAIAGVRMISGVSLSDLGIPRLFPEAEGRAPAVRYEPSSPAIVNEMLRMAAVTKNDIVYDLGSGDGRIVITAAQTTGARGIGVDIDPELIAESRKNAESSNIGHLVQFRKEDLYTTDISKATVVMLYLSPDANLKLRPRLLTELKPGARVVSHSHRMGDWKPDSESEVENHFIYSWIIPSDVSGRWRLEVTDKYAGECSIEFKQSYQEIAVTLKAGRKDVPITGASLRGKRVEFIAGHELGSLAAPVSFSGEVEGNRMSGKYQSGGHSGTWAARRIT